MTEFLDIICTTVFNAVPEVAKTFNASVQWAWSGKFQPSRKNLIVLEALRRQATLGIVWGTVQ